MNVQIKPEPLDQKLKRAYLVLDKASKDSNTNSELTPTRAAVLLTIDYQQGTPVTQIGPGIGQDARSLYRVLEFMEKSKWVVRKNDKDDIRVTRICLTSLGKKKKELAKEYHRNVGKQITQMLSNKKLSKLSELLDELLNNLELSNQKR